ncbi:MAG: glycosyltransferase family 2 protein [Thermoplasmata archaeon]|nr:glycosyltransferase family 2 protein [Thermoplasmata archaeon]
MTPGEAEAKGGPNPSGEGPLISVILTAFSRRAFITGAVRSVLVQRLTSEEVEVIVVKNFQDESIDAFLQSEGVKTLDSGSATYGVMLAMGTRAARGEVVAILDDDDLFQNGKLARLLAVFHVGSRLDFYHNDYGEIDGQGNAPPPSAQRKEIDLRTRSRTYEIFSDAGKVDSFDRMGDSLAEAHTSCLALRRSLLMKVLPYLEPINIGQDFFLYFVGLAGEGRVMIDPGKFTLYRRHPANSSRALAEDHGAYRALVEGSRILGEQTRAMLRSLGAARFLPLLERELSAHRLYVTIAAPQLRRRAIAAAWAGMLRHPRSFRGVGRLELFARSTIFLLVPRLAVRRFRSSPPGSASP